MLLGINSLISSEASPCLHLMARQRCFHCTYPPHRHTWSAPGNNGKAVCFCGDYDDADGDGGCDDGGGGDDGDDDGGGDVMIMMLV